jgi:hypothetical protein
MVEHSTNLKAGRSQWTGASMTLLAGVPGPLAAGAQQREPTRRALSTILAR